MLLRLLSRRRLYGLPLPRLARIVSSTSLLLLSSELLLLLLLLLPWLGLRVPIACRLRSGVLLLGLLLLLLALSHGQVLLLLILRLQVGSSRGTIGSRESVSSVSNKLWLLALTDLLR